MREQALGVLGGQAGATGSSGDDRVDGPDGQAPGGVADGAAVPGHGDAEMTVPVDADEDQAAGAAVLGQSAGPGGEGAPSR
ncbi:hypothetical protein [Streptosporangium sp. NPDC003464]